MAETKEEKFKRLSEKRVNAALDKIRLIGNLASSQYAFSAEQIQSIFDSMRSSITEVEEKFQNLLRKRMNRAGTE
ncbi:MAG: hypothetical protein JXJ19_08100 [Elusimicrobia bacterium]|nr:hypothetical protein [Elusimicrobiota bacterium]